MSGKPKLFNEIGVGGKPYEKGAWKKIATHDAENVKGFFREYRFLSNATPAVVFLDGVQYPSVENAYKAWRWKKGSRTYFENCTPLEAIDYNRKNHPDGPSEEEWNKNKVDIMKFLLMQKFDRNLNPNLYQRLQYTKGKYLEETNWWGDVFWGKNEDGLGENNLGKLLMEIRDTEDYTEPIMV